MPAMHLTSDHPLLLRIVDDLAEHGWSRQPCFLPQGLTHALAAECRQRSAAGQLEPAAVGRGDSQEVREGIRGDRIQWLERGESSACDQYMEVMDLLREAMNRSLFLGLDDYESHFALYPPGAFYRRHIDRFRDDDRRVVSAVVYLNTDWVPAHGGELRLYLKNDEAYDVAPTAGSLVVFLSGEMPHEVLIANRDRLSLTGWFRRRGADVLSG